MVKLTQLRTPVQPLARREEEHARHTRYSTPGKTPRRQRGSDSPPADQSDDAHTQV